MKLASSNDPKWKSRLENTQTYLKRVRIRAVGTAQSTPRLRPGLLVIVSAEFLVTNLPGDYIWPIGMTHYLRAKYHFSTRYNATPMSSRIDTLIQSSPCDCATSHTQIASAMIGTV